MKFHLEFRDALFDHVGRKNVVLMPGWHLIQNGTDWRGSKQLPCALLLHHTAGAAGDSLNPKAKSNQKGANQGVINFIQNHYRVPAANLTGDRDGTIYLHSAYPIWHAGLGSFRGKSPWSSLGIPDNLGNNYMLGIELVSRGMKQDILDQMWEMLRNTLLACKEACDWDDISLVRRPQHKDWTTRKVDLRYTNTQVANAIRAAR
jgi:hypothetical protein